MRMSSIVFSLAAAFCCLFPAFAQETTPPTVPLAGLPVWNVRGEIYTSLEAFTTCFNTTSIWASDKASVKLAGGTKTVRIQPGSVVAVDAQGRRFCLANPPFWMEKSLALPLYPLLDTLGGTRHPDDGTLQLGTKTALICPVTPPVPGNTSLDRTIDNLEDPRLSIESLAKSTGITAQIRPYVEAFVKVAKPVQPAITGIANSKALRLLSHVPVVGSFVSTCQDAIGAINGTISMAQKLVDLDKQYLVPIRDGFAAVQAVTMAPDAVGVLAARPKWIAALDAANKQLATNTAVSKRVTGLIGTLNNVEMKMAAYRKAYPQSKHVLTLGPLQRSIQNLSVMINAHRWQMTTIKDYFTTLVTESANVQKETTPDVSTTSSGSDTPAAN